MTARPRPGLLNLGRSVAVAALLSVLASAGATTAGQGAASTAAYHLAMTGGKAPAWKHKPRGFKPTRGRRLNRRRQARRQYETEYAANTGRRLTSRQWVRIRRAAMRLGRGPESRGPRGQVNA